MKNKRTNKVIQALKENRMALGTAVQIASPEIVEIIGNQGFDFVWIDMEHGHFGVESMVSMVRAADANALTPIVRVLYNEPSLIMQVLDAGAMGVIVPGISSKAEAEAAVKAAKYYPMGMRGSCPWTRATGHCTSDWNKHVKWSNEETMVWLLIEGKEGVDNFDEIIEVPNVDVILFGAFDLSQSLGIPGQIDHPKVQEALGKMITKTQTKGMAIGTVTIAETDPEAIKNSVTEWDKIGGRVVCLGGDRPLLSAVMANALKSAKEGLA